MNKKLFLVLFLMFCLVGNNVSAQPKIDGLSGVERVLTSVQTKVEEVMKKVNAAAKKVQESQLGQSLKTKYETIMAFKQQLTEAVQAGKEAYDEAKSVYDEGVNMVNEGKSFVEDTAGTVKGTYEEAMNDLKQSDIGSTLTLEKELESLQEKMDARKGLVTEELNARIKIVDENTDNLQQLYNSAQTDEQRQMVAMLLTEASTLRTQYEEGLKSMENGESNFLEMDEEYQDLQAQYAQTQELLAEAKEALKQKGLSLGANWVKGMLKKSKEEKAGEYNEVGGANFIGPNEEMNQDSVNRVVTERNKNLKEDMINGFVQVLKMRAGDEKGDEEVDKISENISNADYAITAQRLLNEQKVQKLNLLQQTMQMEVSDLKIKTSGNMLIQDLRMQNPAKNPGEINLDNYELTEDILHERGLGK